MRPRARSKVRDLCASSLDLRQQVVAAVERGDSTSEEVASSFGVGLAAGGRAQAPAAHLPRRVCRGHGDNPAPRARPGASASWTTSPRGYGEQTSIVGALSFGRGLIAVMTLTGAVDTMENQPRKPQTKTVEWHSKRGSQVSADAAARALAVLFMADDGSVVENQS